MQAILSTANWGTALDRQQSITMLEAFRGAGGAFVSTANHYPTSAKAAQFGRANDYLKDWLQSNPDDAPKIICKIGQLDNTDTPAVDVSGAAILTATELVRGRLFDALWGVTLAADPRDSAAAIRATWRSLGDLHKTGLNIGLANITNLKVHAKEMSDTSGDLLAHIKLGANTASEITKYREHVPKTRILLDAYGPLDTAHLAAAMKATSPALFGVAFAPSSLDDLSASLDLLSKAGAQT